MNLKVYEKTRYQNIYRHKKNKNYVIMISKPVKTSISRIDGKRIATTEEAIKIRDNILIRLQKGVELVYKEDFDSLWDKYIDWCKIVKKLSYNTIIRKEKSYNKYLKGKIDRQVTKIDEIYMSRFIEKLDTSDKQKNQVLKEAKTFFNWCKKEYKCILINPLDNVKKIKVSPGEMKYWTPEQLKKFLNCVENDLNSNNLNVKKKSHLIKVFTVLCFSLGDRVGETRALSFNSFDKDKLKVNIFHSINYDRASNDFVSSTKTYQSQRTLDVTQKTIDAIEEYRDFLINLGYNISDDTLIFLNHNTGKPYSDVTLRKIFYYYCEKAGVPRIRMYDLRHTYAATMMMEGKEAYLFSKRMGHKNIQTTINKYGHLSERVRKEVANSTDKYI